MRHDRNAKRRGGPARGGRGRRAPCPRRLGARPCGNSLPKGPWTAFPLPEKALEYLRDHRVDAVFCDIEMPGMSGIAFAKAVKDLQPETHIVFATSYESYALDAFALHATGYLLKPVDPRELRRELTFIYGHPARARRRVEVTTFGGVRGARGRRGGRVFGRTKAKELLALLVDRQGGGRFGAGGMRHTVGRQAVRRVAAQLLPNRRGRFARHARTGGRRRHSGQGVEQPFGGARCDRLRPVPLHDGRPRLPSTPTGATTLPAYSWAEFSVGAIERSLR